MRQTELCLQMPVLSGTGSWFIAPVRTVFTSFCSLFFLRSGLLISKISISEVFVLNEWKKEKKNGPTHLFYVSTLWQTSISRWKSDKLLEFTFYVPISLKEDGDLCVRLQSEENLLRGFQKWEHSLSRSLLEAQPDALSPACRAQSTVCSQRFKSLL